jgi:hypothetical protein
MKCLFPSLSLIRANSISKLLFTEMQDGWIVSMNGLGLCSVLFASYSGASKPNPKNSDAAYLWILDLSRISSPGIMYCGRVRGLNLMADG